MKAIRRTLVLCGLCLLVSLVAQRRAVEGSLCDKSQAHPEVRNPSRKSIDGQFYLCEFSFANDFAENRD